MLPAIAQRNDDSSTQHLDQQAVLPNQCALLHTGCTVHTWNSTLLQAVLPPQAFHNTHTLPAGLCLHWMQLMQTVLGAAPPEKAVIAMSGICKLHLGEIVEAGGMALKQ